MIFHAIAIGVPAVVACTIYVRALLAEQDEHDDRMVEAQRRRDRIEALRRSRMRGES